jgi:hypothetical protein
MPIHEAKKIESHYCFMCLYFLHAYRKHLYKEREMRQRCRRLHGTKAKKYYARLQRFQDKFPLDLYSRYVDLDSDAVDVLCELRKEKYNLTK